MLLKTSDKVKYYYKLIASSKIPINKNADLYTKKSMWARIMGHYSVLKGWIDIFWILPLPLTWMISNIFIDAYRRHLKLYMADTTVPAA